MHENLYKNVSENMVHIISYYCIGILQVILDLNFKSSWFSKFWTKNSPMQVAQMRLWIWLGMFSSNI